MAPNSYAQRGKNVPTGGPAAPSARRRGPPITRTGATSAQGATRVAPPGDLASSLPLHSRRRHLLRLMARTWMTTAVTNTPCPSRWHVTRRG
jgi:hypothetical protein